MGERRALVLLVCLAGCGPSNVGPTDFMQRDLAEPEKPPVDLSMADMAGAPDLFQPDLLIPDVIAPAAITTLTATTTGFTTIRLDWTTVGDDGNTGTATSYDVRQSTAPITTQVEFDAATPITGTLPAPAVAGLMQMVTATALTPGTTYYFAIRVSDEVPNAGPISNSPSATTTPRARFLISEVGAVNTATEGFDFVELVVTTAGRTDGMVVAQASGTLYTLGMLDLSVGDRVVVHATGAPCPTGCDQEDVSGNIMMSTATFASATAWDVYSNTSGIVASDNVVTVADGTQVMDALALSNRDGDATAAAMTAFGALLTGSQWAFSAAPMDTVNDCATQRESVTVATGTTACGGFAIAVAGSSLQRAGTTDTNTKADFYWAAQTPGAANATNPPPTVGPATAPSATEVQVRFSDELAPGSVSGGAFTIPGLTVMAASLIDVHLVSLTTSAQAPGNPYTVTVDNTVTDLQGVAVGAPNSANFNGYVAPDVTAPGAISTLAATTTGPRTVRLDWTTVGDDGATGTATSYDVRYSTTPITTLAEFMAATSAGAAPAPLIAGMPQSMTVSALAPNTLYYFAMRVSDEVPNVGGLSNVPTATTLLRATLLITELSVANAAAQGFDFVELVATVAGRTDGLVVAQTSGSLYTLGALDLAIGDRVVVHASGNPCPAGCAQEDVTGMIAGSAATFASATAWDVYSNTVGLVGTDNVITVKDGTQIQDAVALSNRDGDATASAMTAFAALGSQWTFGATPMDTVNDCGTQRDTVSVATADTACGGFAVGATAGRSLQRNGTADTNTKADFYVAAQTPGAANGANAAPTVVSATPVSATDVRVRFDEEVTNVMTGAFSIPGLIITAAVLVDVHIVSLTTMSQTPGAGYNVSVTTAITDLQGTALGSPSTARFCGFSSTPASLIINEVAPNITTSRDLVELRVTQPGALAGITLRQNPTAAGQGTTLATLPAICAQLNDLVVIHLNPVAGPLDETVNKNDQPNITFSQNYDNAFDVNGGATGVAFSDTVLTVNTAAGTVLDGVAFTDGNGTTVATFDTALAKIQSVAVSAWLPTTCSGACIGAPAEAISVNWSTANGTTLGSNTVARNSTGSDTNMSGDFTVGTQTLGNPN